MVALIALGATINMSCKNKSGEEEVDKETLKTQQSENLVMITSENGNLSYRFETPLLERYELAKEPYMEFTKGIKVVTYNDSTRLVESELEADYAKRIEPLKLWEARGNVIAKNSKGQTLETEQLFWDETTDKVYSNVLSKITMSEDNIVFAKGFESNTEFNNFRFWDIVGRALVDAVTGENSDSTAVASDSLQVAVPAADESMSTVAPRGEIPLPPGDAVPVPQDSPSVDMASPVEE